MRNLLFILLCIFSFVFAESAKDISRNFDLRKPTVLSAEQLDNHLSGVLKGKGQQFKEAEKKYRINALFLVAVAIFESTNGTSNKAKTRNNCFGLRGKTFESVDECIDYVAMILTSPTGYYFGRKKYTIDKVGRTYAPTAHNRANTKWIPSVVSIMKKILSNQ